MDRLTNKYGTWIWISAEDICSYPKTILKFSQSDPPARSGCNIIKLHRHIKLIDSIINLQLFNKPDQFNENKQPNNANALHLKTNKKIKFSIYIIIQKDLIYVVHISEV